MKVSLFVLIISAFVFAPHFRGDSRRLASRSIAGQNGDSCFYLINSLIRKFTNLIHSAPLVVYRNSLVKNDLILEDLLDEDGYLYLFRVINEEYDRSKETSGFWASQNGFVSYSLSPFIDRSWSRRENDFRHMIITRIKIDQYSELYGQSLDADILLSSRYPEPRHFLMDTKTPLHRLDFDEGLDEVNILNDSLADITGEVVSMPVSKFKKLRSSYMKNESDEFLEFHYVDFLDQLRKLQWATY